jgi:RimJ/RimL family protein N-acetyltransferase
VTLRAFEGDEGPVLSRLVAQNLDHLRPWMPWARAAAGLDSHVEYVRRTIDEWEQGTGFGYWLREEASGEMVGCAGLHRRIGPRGLEIGYWVSADRVRRGYATASARALTTAAFELPGVEWVEIHCDEANLASAGVPRRLGYVLERVEEVAAQAPSETGRHQVWVVDAATWHARAWFTASS